MNDITSPTGATQPIYLVQSMHRSALGWAILRVDVERVSMPTLESVQIGKAMGGALLPSRVYIAQLTIGWALRITPTTSGGVRVELHDQRKHGATCPDQAWRWATERVLVDLPWWPLVQACEWGAGEAGAAA